MSTSSSGWAGNLMSRTASSFPEVIQEIGPVNPVAYWACSMGNPSMRKRAWDRRLGSFSSQERHDCHLHYSPSS
jgi:hypothetical protein